jgi:predicted MFS family arabinose efflux permease
MQIRLALLAKGSYNSRPGEENSLTDKRKAWAVMVVVFLASIVVAAGRFKVPPVLPVLMDELQVDMVTGGWLMSLSSVAGIVLAIPAAFLLTRIGLKLTGLVAMGCAVVGTVVGALATGTPAILLGRVIEGVSVSLMVVMAPTAISLWFPPRERGLPMGIWTSWVPIGNVLMFNLAHPVMVGYGWRAVWWLGAVFSLVALVLVGLVVDSPPQESSEGSSATAPPGEFGRMLLNGSAWLLALAFGAFGFALLGYNTWAPKFLTDTLQVEPAAANAYASLMFLAAVPANIIAGWLINRLKDRYSMLPAAFFLTTILFFWGFRLDSVGVVVPYMLVLGFVSNFVPTAVFTLAPETMPRIQLASLGLAIVMTGTNMGSVAGPPALGAILSSGDWFAGSICLVAAMAVGTVAAWYVARRLRSESHGSLSPEIPNPPPQS